MPAERFYPYYSDLDRERPVTRGEILDTIWNGRSGGYVRYRLIVLTHGAMETLPGTLESFNRKVVQAPCDTWIHVDGGWPMKPYEETIRSTDPVIRGKPYRLTSGPVRRGFCGSVKRCWEEAARNDVEADYVFWLEHDFVFGREINLDYLKAPLDADPKLAQMSLMRNAVNAREVAAGGLYKLYRDQYAPRALTLPKKTWDSDSRAMVEVKSKWLEHRAYFTTNPSLMTVKFMQENPWPSYSSECEGRFGRDLVDKGYKFGVYGDGEPWVAHVGTRTGEGY